MFAVIERHRREPISLRHAAATVSLSPGHLTTVVRRKTGRPPVRAGEGTPVAGAGRVRRPSCPAMDAEPPLVIRRLGPRDAEVLAALAHDAADFDLAGRSGPEPPLPPGRAAEYLADPSVLHWVGERDGRVEGELLCHLLRLPSGAGRELLLYAIGVREDRRRRGVGRALVAGMLAWMAAEDVPEVWVLADNPGAEAFYAACGFRRGEDDEQGLLMIRPA